MKVYKAINTIQIELAKVGISKGRRNQQGSGYNFRGIDDVYNVLSPLLGAHGLCILPRMLSREVAERKSNSGGNLFYVTVEAEFDLVSAEDGSKHTIKTFGEAMDSGDKATNKAMSAAYKYAAFQAFAIPTEGDNDSEAQTHEFAPIAIEPKLSDKREGELIDIALTASSLSELKDVYNYGNSEYLKARQDNSKFKSACTARRIELEKVA